MLDPIDARFKINSYNRSVDKNAEPLYDEIVSSDDNTNAYYDLAKSKIPDIDVNKITSDNIEFIGKKLAQIINLQGKNNVAINLLVCKSDALSKPLIDAIDRHLKKNLDYKININTYSQFLYEASFTGYVSGQSKLDQKTAEKEIISQEISSKLPASEKQKYQKVVLHYDYFLSIYHQRYAIK